MSRKDRQQRRQEPEEQVQEQAQEQAQDANFGAGALRQKLTQSVANKEFEAALKDQRTEAFQEMKGNIKDRTSFYVRRGHDRGRAYEKSLKALYVGKANAITAAFREMRAQQGKDVESIHQNYLISKHKVVLDALAHRFDLILDISGNGKISTDAEAVEFADYGYRILQDIDVYSLIFDKEDGKGILQAYVMSSLGEKPQDKIELIERIDTARRNGEEISKEDLQMLTSIIFDKSGKTKDNMVMMMVSYLDYKQRFALVDFMVEQEQPGTAGLIQFMAQVNYLTRAQAVALAKKQADKPEYQEVLAYLNTDKLRRTQQGVAKIQSEKGAIMHRAVGHKNYAKDLFSLKGIASGLLFANGALTTALNIAVNITHPADIPGNPAIWLGAGMMGIGSQWSGGFGGLMPTPEKLAARTFRSKKERDEEAAEKQDAVIGKMRGEIAQDFEIAEFYFRHAETINGVYRSKKTATNPKPRLTLKDIGFEGEAYEDLPEDFKKVPKERVNEALTNWVYQFHNRLGKADAAAQRNFINDVYEDESLSPLEV